MPTLIKHIISIFCLGLLFVFGAYPAYTQQIDTLTEDTLRKEKKSFLKKVLFGIKSSFGKDTTGRKESITELNTRYLLPHEGKIIRTVSINQLGFEKSIGQQEGNLLYFGTRILNATHMKTRKQTIERNIFLKEGSKFNPYLAADNERYLRTIRFIQDSRITVKPLHDGSDSVDIIVFTKDIFSYAPSIGGLGPNRQRIGLTHLNVAGTGQQLSFDLLHDAKRSPEWGISAGYAYNNIAGSFINAMFSAGKITRNIYDRREDEESFLLDIEMPLVSLYRRIAGGLTLGMGNSLNRYPNSYGGDFYRYKYGVADLWAGYNSGAVQFLNGNALPVKRFFALRVFNYHFFETPYQIEKSKYDQRFNSRQGILGSLTLFRQYYYKTKYIYGFGITEDVPAGYNVSITAGWYKQLDLSRPYLGMDAYRYIVSSKRDILGLFLRTGMFFRKNSIEDLGISFGASYYSRILNIGNTKMRQYFRMSYSTILNRLALDPLRINNSFGLRNFNSDLASGTSRLSLRSETFLFTEQKYFGFHIGPFGVADLSWLHKDTFSTDSAGLFFSIGGGLRVRNENLAFGTFELRGVMLPRKLPGDNRFKISLAINLQFRYNSSYVSKPDIVELNNDITRDIY